MAAESDPPIEDPALGATPDPVSSSSYGAVVSPAPDQLNTAPIQTTTNFGVGLNFQNPTSTSAVLVSRMTPEHIGKVIEQEDQEGKRQHVRYLVNAGVGAGLAAFGMLMIFALSVAFLIFNRPEYLQGIIGLIAGLVGGGGVGYSVGRSTAPRSDTPAR